MYNINLCLALYMINVNRKLTSLYRYIRFRRHRRFLYEKGKHLTLPEMEAIFITVKTHGRYICILFIIL